MNDVASRVPRGEPEMRSGVLAGGNWIVDHVKVIDAWPAQDALASIIRDTSGNGGAPYNVLKDLTLLGATFPRAAVGLVGDDENGHAILADCAAHQIDVAQLRAIPGVATSYTDVMTVQGTGRRTFFHQRGANALLEAKHFDFAQTRAKIFHLGYLLLLDRLDADDGSGRPAVCALLEAATAAGMKTSVDVVSESSDRFQRVVRPALAHVDYCFINDYETERLTGIELRRDGVLDRTAVTRAAREIVGLGVKELVLVHAPEASVVCSARGASVWQPSLAVPRPLIKGSAGAGDALAAGVLFGLHENWPIERCLKLGACAAAASLFEVTCSSGIRSAEQCLALADTFGLQAWPS